MLSLSLLFGLHSAPRSPVASGAVTAAGLAPSLQGRLAAADELGVDAAQRAAAFDVVVDADHVEIGILLLFLFDASPDEEGDEQQEDGQNNDADAPVGEAFFDVIPDGGGPATVDFFGSGKVDGREFFSGVEDLRFANFVSWLNGCQNFIR